MATAEAKREVGFTKKTPSGLEVYYQTEPKRLYRINGEEVPSVTTVLGILNKDGLAWWGMRIGLKAVLELFARGFLRFAENDGNQILAVPAFFETGAGWAAADEYNLEQLVKDYDLTVNDQRDKAGDRGQSAHDALEEWVKTGIAPAVHLYPEHEQGYVTALLAFMADLGEVKNVESEVMIGSTEHGYAGRYDVTCFIKKCSLVETVASPGWPKFNKDGSESKAVKPESRMELAGGRYMFDLKTSKRVYNSHHLQLAAYEHALAESGYKPTKAQIIVNVHENGTYECRRSVATIDHFAAVLGAYNASAHLEELMKA